MKRSMLLTSLTLLAILGASTAHAQQVQANFSLTPPPFAWPTFEKGGVDLKMRLTTYTMDGAGIDLTGGGVDGVVRNAFSDHLATGIQIGLFGMTGGIDSFTAGGGMISLSHSDVSMGDFLLAASMEAQPFRNDRVATLLFAGPALAFLFGDYDSTTVRNGPPPAGISAFTDSGSIMSYLYGVRGGGQLGVRLGNVHVDLFGTVGSQEGRSRISTAFGNLKNHVPAATVVSVGLDLVYLPWNLSLSAVLQETESTGANQRVKTRMYQAGWKF